MYFSASRLFRLVPFGMAAGLFPAGLLVLRPVPVLGAQLAYCNITDLKYSSVTNGVNIRIVSDGVLDWEEGRGFRQRWATRIPIRFPHARSKLAKSTFNVKMFPVSHVQVTVPQDAEQGIGLLVVVTTYTPVTFKIDRSTNQRVVMIMVDKPYTVENHTSVVPVTGDVTTRLTVRAHDNLLDVSAVKADLHELLGEIARQTGVNIAVDDAVQRKVSMSLTDMAVGDVIRGVASGYGLSVSQHAGTFRISEGVPDTLATYNVSSTESFPIEYLRASTARGLLPNFLFSYVNTNWQQNAVVATAPTQMLDKIRSDLKKVDQPPPQIMIEALAVEFADTKDLDLGLDVVNRESTFSETLNTQTGVLSYRTIGKLPEDFKARITALAQSGRAKIYANPRMAAVNGGEAEIFIGRQRFIKVEYLRWGQQQEKIQAVDVGVKLNVSPWTGGNGEVTMTIKPEVSNIQEIDEQTGLPVLSTRRADTDVRVKDGETVIIGGLTLRQEFKTKSKVPVLGDIPLLGELFTRRRTNAVNSELVIFVTPHILTERGRLPDAATEARLRQRFLEQP